jgi:hypothetical protein
MAPSSGHRVLYTILGLNRAGRILWGALFVLAVPALVGWFVLLPRLRFSDADEGLFKAARHGSRAGVEQALAAGAHVDAASPVDGKTALFRAAIFGHADVVRVLLDHGANAAARGTDGQSALDVVTAARAAVKTGPAGADADAHALDDVAAVLREAAGPR